MKQSFLYAVMLPLLTVLVMTPAVTFAKGGDDWDDNDDDESGLEVEADIFTDITVVKVEINDRKSVFSTEADTRDEVVAAVVARYGLKADDVEAVLEIETEDRSSRPQDRGKLNREMMKEKEKAWKREVKDKKWWGNHGSSTPKTCTDDDATLDIEADVFTDKTVVKIEFVNAKDEVFTTSATTSSGVVDAVAAKYSSLTKTQIEAALDFEIEDRASRAADLVVDVECAKWSKPTSTPAVVNEAKIAELRARIAELQSMLERIISLMRGS